ncbi:hypothetical protein K8942_00180 [Candidatus Peribacteria bacterium]|nr:MAG: hypothetical protein K8942_00180 [Candidatus Peribacteria bacterium]
MTNRFFQRRAGSTLVELLIFAALLGIVMGAVLPLLFMAAEDRLLQQTISLVERNGVQAMQNITQRVRNGERIITPALGMTGSVLVVQTSSGAINPTIVGINSGSLIVIERVTKEIITSSQVAITHFEVRNTSVSDTHPSVEIIFNVSRTTRLQQPHSYGEIFRSSITLFPNDLPSGANDQCVAPFCLPANTFNWQIYDPVSADCLEATLPMTCT